MHNSEKEDFDRFIKERNLEGDHFEITNTIDPIPSGGIYPLTGTVSVRFKKTNKFKIYSSGNNSSWVYEFISDYEAGYFS